MINRKKCKRLLLSLAFSAVFFIICAEITIRVYTYFVTYYDIEMTRYALELKTDAGNPRIGHVHKPNSHAQLMNVTVDINSDGLRDREYEVAKGEAYRLVFLGDSLTFGWGVEQRETFADLLEKHWSQTRPTEVLNFGTGNYNTDQQIQLFLAKGLKYQPDHVVIFYFINDAEKTPVQSGWRLLAHLRFVTFVWSRIRALRHRVSYADYYSSLYREGQIGWQRSKEAFLTMQKICAENSIRLQVVILPELHQLQNYPFVEEHQRVTDFLNQNGIDNVDLTPYFSEERNPPRLWVARDDAHPNNIAHSLIAEYARDFIARKWDDRKN